MTWTWNKVTGSFTCSPAFCALFGRDPHLSAISDSEMQLYYTAPSWKRLQEALADTLPGSAFIIESEVRLADGTLQWIRQRGQANLLVHGQIEKIKKIDGELENHSKNQYSSQQVGPGYFQNARELLHLLDSLPVCISYIDTQFRYQFINQTYLTWFDLQKTQIIGKHLRDVIGDMAFEAARPHLEQAFLGQTVCFEDNLPYILGGTRFVAAQFQPQFSTEGQVQGCYSLIQDISQRKKNEETLRIKEERWQLALESSGDGVWDWYPQQGVEIFSKRLKEIYGYRDDDIADLSTELDKRTHPDDLIQMRLDRAAHFDGATPIYTNEHRVLCKDGQWKWILTRGTVVQRDQDGQPLRVVGTHTDISERRQAEAALRESEERLRMALSATHQGLYDVNVTTGVAIVNVEYAKMLGYEHATFHESNEAWLARTHPDDRQHCRQAYTDYVHGDLDGGFNYEVQREGKFRGRMPRP